MGSMILSSLDASEEEDRSPLADLAEASLAEVRGVRRELGSGALGARWSELPLWAIQLVSRGVEETCGAPGLLSMSCCCSAWRRAVLSDSILLRRVRFAFKDVHHDMDQGNLKTVHRKMYGSPCPAREESLPLLLRNACQLSNPTALSSLAEVLESNDEIARALRLHVEAAKLGHRKSMVRVATAYYLGEGNMAWDPEEALRWFKKAAGGSVIRDHVITDTLDSKAKGKEERRRYASEDQELKLSSQAALMLGFMHLDGEGTKVDIVEAIKWFKHASSCGNGEAQKQLGVLFNTGQY